MMTLRNNSAPCQVVFKHSQYLHSFGGTAIHIGSTPARKSAPMHLVFNFDLSDPLVPLEVADKDVHFLPLYYPLRYGDGGGEAQYRVISDAHIELIYVSESGPDDDEEMYPHLEAFPKIPCSLKTIPYESYRALLMREHGMGYEPSPKDTELCQELMSFVYLAPNVLPFCGELTWRCQNVQCRWFDKHSTLSTFARISATPTGNIEMFGEHGTDVEIYFSMCRMCSTIVTQNRCS